MRIRDWSSDVCSSDLRTLAIGVGLSHAGTVRLVDRLATEGLIERRGHATDARARALYLTAAGQTVCAEVLNARDQIIAEGLSVLSNEELVILGALSERVLRARLQGLEHVYRSEGHTSELQSLMPLSY